MAYDKVAFFSLKTAKYDDMSNQLYHLAYFVMLITGVFDDLAHIIYEFLTALDTQMDINVFYPIRDSLQHRELPIGMEFSEGSEVEKNVFALSSETYEEIKKISDALIFIIRSKSCFLDPLPFIKWAQEVTITIVNRVLSSIDRDSVYADLPKDIQDKIRASNENYEQELRQALGLPEEPIYF